MTGPIRSIVVGLGVQGHKRRAVAGDDCVATVDPVHPDADVKSLDALEFDSFDAAFVCTPDEPKIELLRQLLAAGKHVLVEKPLLGSDVELAELEQLAVENGAVCMTAYNHRYEPHFLTMKALLDAGDLGKIYSMRLFYGNGTARLVRDSVWRDQGAGVLPDLGSHLLDTILFWLGPQVMQAAFSIQGAWRHENRAFDHVVLSAPNPAIQLEMALVSWRNDFTCDVFGEKGSAHISSLCKWGPSTFTHRRRVLPAGRPDEETVTRVCNDPTWAGEYAAFVNACQKGEACDPGRDRWINQTLNTLAAQAETSW